MHSFRQYIDKHLLRWGLIRYLEQVYISGDGLRETHVYNFQSA